MTKPRKRTAPAPQFSIHGACERYSMDENFNISRPAIGMAPSGQWKFRALLQKRPFGMLGGMIRPEQLESFIRERPNWADWHYRNGKPRFVLSDIHHGTTRVWGEEIHSITIIPERAP